MARYAFIVLSMFFFAFTAAYAVPSEAGASGSVVVPDDNSFEWDFGTISAGSRVRHDFVFKNSSGKVIKVQDVTSSCGCTVSEVKRKTIPPGEETVISVEFNSEGYSGHVQQFVYVSTDDVDNPILRYTIKVFLSTAA